MITERYLEDDWRLFKRKIPGWQLSHMEKLCRSYEELLHGAGTWDEKFWTLSERIQRDQKSAGVSVDMRRSQLVANILGLIDDGVISMEDLEDFSDTLKATVRSLRSL